MRVIVAGGRDFFNRCFMWQKLDIIFSKTPLDDITIISGGATGADTLAIEYAKSRGIKYTIENADWYPERLKGKMDRSAGHKRNVRMGLMATHLVAFWDGFSSGTDDMISIAKCLKLNIRVIRYGT